MSPAKRALSALATAAVLGAAVCAPAAAESASYDDPADASASLTDIRQVEVRHTADRVVVTVGFTDLRRRSEAGPAGLAVFVDVDGVRRGPEYQLGTGLQAGTDYQLVRSRHRRGVGEPLDCDYRVMLQYHRDRMIFRADRACFDDPERVRVGMRMTDDYDGSHPVRDWLGAPRSWTAWLTSS